MGTTRVQVMYCRVPPTIHSKRAVTAVLTMDGEEKKTPTGISLNSSLYLHDLLLVLDLLNATDESSFALEGSILDVSNRRNKAFWMAQSAKCQGSGSTARNAPGIALVPDQGRRSTGDQQELVQLCISGHVSGCRRDESDSKDHTCSLLALPF